MTIRINTPTQPFCCAGVKVLMALPGTMRAIILLILLPALVSAGPASTTRPTIAQSCEVLLAQWKPRFNAARFTCVISPPFVIAGDGGAAAIARYRDGTIERSARALQATYFKTQPDEPILILLFETDASYRRLAIEWFNDRDVPHFGFYRPHDRIMLMNVGTGTGTLVHELTHALMAPDFPTVPDWFNEGLASLYEQSSLGPNDSITGLVNWRLPALQRAIRQGELRSTDQMINDPDFRADVRVGLNYAHARYVMLYLQERGLLRDFYQRSQQHATEDHQGLESFKQIIAPLTIESFDTQWRRWVLTLKF